MTWVFAGILVYLAAQLALGFWVSRRVASESDYLLAGRRLGYGLSIFTIFATWFGAETVTGSAGRAYEGGLSNTLSDPFGYTIALLVFGLLFAAAFWRRKLTTLADLFRARFGVGVERLAVLLMVPSSILWAAAQVRAFGQVLSLSSDLTPVGGITLAAVVVIAYTTAGGLLADAWTDLVQGIVLIAGVITLGAVVAAAGGLAALAEMPAERLSLAIPDASLLDTLEAWSAPILGSLVAQELIQRALAARSGEVARNSALIAAGMYLAVGLIPALIGLAAWRLIPGLSDPETTIMVVASTYLPTALYVLFAGAVVSAILSTVDTALLVAGSLVAHNVVLPLAPDLDERRKLRANRIAVAASGVVAYALALGSDSAYELVEEAAAFGTAGIFVVTVFAMWTDLGGRLSAYSALVVGSVVYAVGNHGELLPHPYLTALAAALACYLAGSVVSRAPTRE